ncbi:stimulator of interferon genes protein 7-like isoform X2 [Oculina patagonica]
MAEQHREFNVAQQENNGFGPIFDPRGKAASFASGFVVIISGLIIMFCSGFGFLVFAAALLTLSLVLGELIRRLCLVAEEIRHKEKRYRGNWKYAFKSAFTFGRSGPCILVFAVAVVFIVIVCYALYEQYEFYSRTDLAVLLSINCFLVPQLLFLVGLRELSPVEASEINERENKNVADGLAWSYYFGYLKLVLPKLEEQIGKSEQFRFKITRHKLFILLPKTCYTYDDIVDADSRVKFAGHLPEYKKSRGGIKERPYKHAVHRVEMPRPDGKIDEYHFVLEYATPLMSLYDMSVHNDACLSRQELDHQVVLFTRKLKEILDHSPECKGKYELVTISGDRENGKNIADVLVEMNKAANIELGEGVEAE